MSIPNDHGPAGWTSREGIELLIARSDRVELEQAKLRVVIAGLVLLYIAWYVSRSGGNSPQPLLDVLMVAVGFFWFWCLLFIRILSAGKPSVPRRFLGMVVDNAVTTYCLIRMGEDGAALIGVYLFITFGNGFRYGRFYLHACQAMSLAGFALVLFKSDYWSHSLSIGIGFLVSLIVLPFYVGVLAERINKEKQRADDARVKAEEALREYVERQRLALREA